MQKEALELFDQKAALAVEEERIENELNQKLAEIDSKKMRFEELVDTDSDGYVAQ